MILSKRSDDDARGDKNNALKIQTIAVRSPVRHHCARTQFCELLHYASAPSTTATTTTVHHQPRVRLRVCIRAAFARLFLFAVRAARGTPAHAQNEERGAKCVRRARAQCARVHAKHLNLHLPGVSAATTATATTDSRTDGRTEADSERYDTRSRVV